VIRLKRAYEKPAPGDGERILVERLWPRGLAKAEAKLDAWLKDIAPSPELRKWFGHDPDKWERFERRYREELAAKERDLRGLRWKAKRGTVTLVYAARDQEHNSAVVLKSVLDKRKHRPARPKKGT
jgi:uncharacterized protein YeaO (DUF488 family)